MGAKPRECQSSLKVCWVCCLSMRLIQRGRGASYRRLPVLFGGGAGILIGCIRAFTSSSQTRRRLEHTRPPHRRQRPSPQTHQTVCLRDVTAPVSPSTVSQQQRAARLPQRKVPRTHHCLSNTHHSSKHASSRDDYKNSSMPRSPRRMDVTTISTKTRSGDMHRHIMMSSSVYTQASQRLYALHPWRSTLSRTAGALPYGKQVFAVEIAASTCRQE